MIENNTTGELTVGVWVVAGIVGSLGQRGRRHQPKPYRRSIACDLDHHFALMTCGVKVGELKKKGKGLVKEIDQ